MITNMITGSVYAMLSPQQSSQHKADANGFMSDVRSIQVTQEFGEALVERAELLRVKGTDFVADVEEASTSYEAPKGNIVDAWA